MIWWYYYSDLVVQQDCKRIQNGLQMFSFVALIKFLLLNTQCQVQQAQDLLFLQTSTILNLQTNGQRPTR